MEEEQSTPFASEDTALARAKGVGRKALASGLHFHRRRYPLSECSVLQGLVGYGMRSYVVERRWGQVGGGRGAVRVLAALPSPLNANSHRRRAAEAVGAACSARRGSSLILYSFFLFWCPLPWRHCVAIGVPPTHQPTPQSHAKE